MRKDAALLTLRLSSSALAGGFELKDASAFNVLFDGCRPRFIDHGSFRESYSGHWPGYSQFGNHFMNPLLVEAHAGVAAQSLGFGIDGLATSVAAAMLGGRSRVKRGVLAWIGRRRVADRLSDRAGIAASRRLAETQLPKAVVAKILDRTASTVANLASSAPSYWRTYETSSCPYDIEESEAKQDVISDWLSKVEEPRVALDVGCNVGTFSKILAGRFERVIAIDNDSVAIDVLYRRGASASWGGKITPAVVDITQPTPAMGWRNVERAAFLDRLGTVDLSLWLAVIHHVILSGGIPLAEILSAINNLSGHAIIEHIAPEDPSVESMTASRQWAHVPTWEEFAAALNEAGMSTVDTARTSQTRTLVMVRCRP